jgi:hypothetical protein
VYLSGICIPRGETWREGGILITPTAASKIINYISTKSMKYTFLPTLNKIVQFIDGSIYFPKCTKDLGYHIGIFFYLDGKVFIDNLVLIPVDQEVDCGIMIRSFLTNGRLISLAEYTCILIDTIEDYYKLTLLMCPLTYRFYNIGNRFRKGLGSYLN